MNKSIELSKFQERCHQYFTCFTFASMGLQSIADNLRPGIVEGLDQNFLIGSGHPDQGKAHSKVKLKDAVISSGKDGLFSDTIAKSIIVAVYSEWDVVYRPAIAREVGSQANDLASDLMGDLRLVRHWIIHNKSVVDKNCSKIKELSWRLRQDQELKVTGEMFSDLIDSINVMAVTVHAV